MDILVSVVGSLAGVVAVALAYLQLRRSPQPSDSPGRALPEPLRDSMPAPLGRLPPVVRGRDRLLDQIEALAGSPDGRTHVLAGLGGVGKSTVALKLAERVARDSRRVWWISAVDRTTLTGSLIMLMRELGATLGQIEDVEAERRDLSDLLWSCLLRHRGWVLIFDNADDLTQLETNGRRIADGSGLIRACDSGLVIVTSRVGDPVVWGPHTRIHHVAPLDEADGARALLDLAPSAGTSVDARELSRRLGGLPLGLHHAGYYLSSPFVIGGFADYRRLLEVGTAPWNEPGTGDRESLGTTWDLTLHSLEQQGLPRARAVLEVLSTLAVPEPVPARVFHLPLMAELCRPATVEPVLRGLASTGLIERRSSGDAWAVTIHPLVAEVQRRRTVEAGIDGERCGQAVLLLHQAQQDLDTDQHLHWPSWRELISHFAALAGRADCLTEERLTQLVGALQRAVAAMVAAGEPAVAASLGNQAVAATSELEAADSCRLSALATAAFASRVRGRLDEAERIYREILEPRRRMAGDLDPLTLLFRYELALIRYARGELPDTVHEFELILEGRRVVFGPDALETLMVQYSLAWTLMLMGQTRRAAAEFEAVRQIWRRTLGDDHPKTLHARQSLAFVNAELGHVEEAVDELEVVAELSSRLLGETHPCTLETRQHLAAVRHQRGETEQAETELEEIISVKRELLGSHHSATKEAEAVLQHLRDGQDP
ncbi:tetratricopeptide repeat protein [Spirillospora sp. CA-108201]